MSWYCRAGWAIDEGLSVDYIHGNLLSSHYSKTIWDVMPETHCDHDEHALRHVEGVSPVVIRHSSVVLPHS